MGPEITEMGLTPSIARVTRMPPAGNPEPSIAIGVAALVGQNEPTMLMNQP